MPRWSGRRNGRASLSGRDAYTGTTRELIRRGQKSRQSAKVETVMHRVHADRRYAAVALPRVRRKPASPVRDFRARGQLRLVQAAGAKVESDACVVCEATIDRFDRATFLVAARCCACESALS